MGGYIDFGVDLITGGMAKYGQVANPIFFPGPVEPRYSTFLSFIGFSVENDQQYYMDATVAYQHGRDRRLSARVPERHRVSEEVRLLGRAGVPVAGVSTRRRPDQRHRRHPQRVLHSLLADRDLRLRHSAKQRRASRGLPRLRGQDIVAWGCLAGRTEPAAQQDAHLGSALRATR